jgi:hypothetical protein
MEPDDLLCSRNARSRTPLVGRAQWKINQAPSLRRQWASLERICLSPDADSEGQCHRRLSRCVQLLTRQVDSFTASGNHTAESFFSFIPLLGGLAHLAYVGRAALSCTTRYSRLRKNSIYAQNVE